MLNTSITLLLTKGFMSFGTQIKNNEIKISIQNNVQIAFFGVIIDFIALCFL